MGCVPQGCTDVLSTASSAALKLWWRWELAHPALHRLWCFWVQNCQLLQGWVAALWFYIPFAAWPFPELCQDQVCVSTGLSSLQHTHPPFPLALPIPSWHGNMQRYPKASAKLPMGLWSDAPALVPVPCMGRTLALALSKQHGSGLQHH